MKSGRLTEKFYIDSVKKIEAKLPLGKADLHIHSNLSDAKPSIEEILDWVEHRTRLDIIAITDHDTIEGALRAEQLSLQKKYRFKVVIGEEISTKEGHIIGLFLRERVAPGLSVHEALSLIRAQDGIAVAAHPFNYNRINGGKMPVQDGIGILTLIKERDQFDAIEIINATPTRGDENLKARLVNDAVLFKAELGSSDAHILEAIGMGYTVFEGRTTADLQSAILENQTRAMSKKWRILALLKYAYFFLPKGLRMLGYTIRHGRRARRPEMLDFKRDVR